MFPEGRTAFLERDAADKPTISDYEMVGLIGRGAYGDVWLARGLTGIYRAVKVVWRNRFSEAAPYDREFRGLSEFAPISLNMPGQLALLHIGRNETGGYFYYVMELADDVESGGEIRPKQYVPHTLRELRLRRGRLPADECVELGIQLCACLSFLHERNLIHRDIKPSNIVLVGGRLKLADIGLISAQDEARTFVGTEGYVPPEGPVTAASDVFSLGKVIYELATGRDRRDFPSLPEKLDVFPDRSAFLRLNTVILRACERDPARRYQTASHLLADLQTLQRGKTVRRPWSRRLWSSAALAAGLVLALGAGYWWDWRPRIAVVAPAQITAPHSVAVLPFANLSPDPANAFFADGVHEDLIVNLAKIRELRVTPRASVMSYREKQDDLPAIARDLAVTHLLEGTVRRSGQQIRLTAKLIETKGNRPIWARTYDRALTDVFAIQRELAELIAEALEANLTPTERRLLARRATDNQEAYDLYLQARARDESLGNQTTLDQFRPVIALYEQAVAKDPKFALAYAQLCMLHTKLYWFAHLDATPERLALAEAAAQAAVRLAPNDPETRLALGKLAYNGRRDYAKALVEFKAAEAGMPNSDQVLSSIAYTLRRVGKWEEALDYLHRAAALNPRAVTVGLTIVETLSAMRRYSRAGSAANDFLTRFPNNRSAAAFLATARFEIDQNRESYLTALDALPVDPRDPHHLVERYQAAYRRGEWAVADEILADPRVSNVFDWTAASDVIVDYAALARARVAFLRGQREAAQVYAEQALAKYRAGTWISQNKLWLELRMAEANAYCGRSDAALRGIEAAQAELRAAPDINDAVVMQPLLGRIYCILNRRTEALDMLAKMTNGACQLGPQQIRHDPFWSQFAADPRFERILASAKEL